MKVSKKTEDSIVELQQLEQNISAFLMQKQAFQAQLMEAENALGELEKQNEKVYKIVGPLMIESKKEDVKKDLISRKEILDLRVKSIEKQEAKLKEKAEEIQKEVLKEIKNE